MAPPPWKQQADAELGSAKVMAGVLAVLVADREERMGDDGSGPVKTEILLRNAGFSAPEIARVMGKNVEAVRKTIQRGRK
jgi:DNA-directed RNA polymerase specialized sigma24 family protein